MNWLKGEKVNLRALEPSDLESLYKWENNANLWHVSNAVSPYSKYILKEYIDKAPKDIYENKQLRLIVEIEENGEKVAVGAVDLFEYDPFHNRSEVGIIIDEAYRNRGLGLDAMNTIKTYAFDFLHLNMLSCYVGADNPGSKAFFLKSGFVVCGEIKGWLKGVDGYIDSWLLQCLNPNNK